VQPIERTEVRQILNDLEESCRDDIERRLVEVSLSQVAKGSFQSAGTIRLVVRAMEEAMSSALSAAFDRIASVSKEPDALPMVSDFLQRQLGFVDGQLEGFAALNRKRPIPLGESDEILNGCRQQFEQSRRRLMDQIELQRAVFSAFGSPSALKPDNPKNRGGRPRAAHWDEMWATIAALLYNGDLKPKSQVAIAKAMQDWLMVHDVDVGDTPVRDRARLLWMKIQETE